MSVAQSAELPQYLSHRLESHLRQLISWLPCVCCIECICVWSHKRMLCTMSVKSDIFEDDRQCRQVGLFFLVIPRKINIVCLCRITACVNMIFSTCICYLHTIVLQNISSCMTLAGSLTCMCSLPSPIIFIPTFSPLPLSLHSCLLPPGKAVFNGKFGADSNLTITNSSSSEEMNIAAGKCDSGL